MSIRIHGTGLLWGLAGAAAAAIAMLMAGAGLAVLPLWLPLIVLVALLVEARAPYAWAAGLGVVAVVDIFAIVLVVAPPCLAPVLTNLGNGEFELSCAEHQSMLPLAAAVAVGTVVVSLLILALGRRRFGRDAGNYDHADDADPDQ